MEQIVIEVDAKILWEHLGESFGDIYLYDRNVTTSIGFGPPVLRNAPSDKRRIRYPENYEYIERLSHFSPQTKSLSFINLKGFRFPYTKIEVFVEIVSVEDNISTLNWKLDLKPTFWTFFYLKRVYAKAIHKHYRAQFRELKYFLENNKQKRVCKIDDYNFTLLFDY